ncbi:MAG TPA: CsbD family protein [Dehalococcoidia bacterium]
MTTERDRWEGKGKEAAGSVKEKAGEITGDEDMEAEGKAKKYEGKAQDAWGRVKETAREAKDKI